MGNWDLSLLPEEKFNKQTFDEYYTEYEQYLYSNLPIKYHVGASLENFDYILPSSTIILSSNIRIVHDKNKYNVVYNCKSECFDELEEPPGDVYNLSNFWLEIDCEIEKRIVPLECKERIEHISLEKIQEVFKILRLYKEGDFRYGLIYWCPKTPCDPPYNEHTVLFYSGSYCTPNKYSIQEDDIKELQLLFQKYSNNSSKKDFPHSAIYYLDKGVRENDMTDRLVDYTAALESLFVDGKQEITTLLAYRTAFFLEANRQKCGEIYKDLKKAYGFRSNIVHGNRSKIKDELELKEYCNKTERYVRQAIIKWIDMIEKGNRTQEIYDLIQDKIFS